MCGGVGLHNMPPEGAQGTLAFQIGRTVTKLNGLIAICWMYCINDSRIWASSLTGRKTLETIHH